MSKFSKSFLLQIYRSIIFHAQIEQIIPFSIYSTRTTWKTCLSNLMLAKQLFPPNYLQSPKSSPIRLVKRKYSIERLACATYMDYRATPLGSQSTQQQPNINLNILGLIMNPQSAHESKLSLQFQVWIGYQTCFQRILYKNSLMFFLNNCVCIMSDSMYQNTKSKLNLLLIVNGQPIHTIKTCLYLIQCT